MSSVIGWAAVVTIAAVVTLAVGVGPATPASAATALAPPLSVAVPSFLTFGGSAVTTDGSLVVALVGSGSTVVRLMPSGSLDGSFGTSGSAPVSFTPREVRIDPAGRIVVAGSDGHDFVVARLLGNGQADASFGAAGQVSFAGAAAGDVAVAADGGLFVSFFSQPVSPATSALERLKADGSLDTAFGQAGSVPVAGALAALPSGGVAVTGHLADASYLVVYDAAGQLRSGASLKPNPLADSVTAEGSEYRVAGGAGVGLFRADGSLDPTWGAGVCAQLVPDGPLAAGHDVIDLPGGGFAANLAAGRGAHEPLAPDRAVGVAVYDAGGQPDNRVVPGGLVGAFPGLVDDTTLAAGAGRMWWVGATRDGRDFVSQHLAIEQFALPDASAAQPTPRPSPEGVVVVAGDGGVFTRWPNPTTTLLTNGYSLMWGQGVFCGSTGGLRLNQPVVGVAELPGGYGYWLVAADGGVFSFGDAHFYGSTGAMRLNQPVVGMAATPDGGGYWLVAADGGVFSFGDAHFYGSTGAMRLNQPIVGMAAAPDGGGYWLVAADGGVFSFGDATFHGSAVTVAHTGSVVGLAAAGVGGYWIATSTNQVFGFGDASSLDLNGAPKQGTAAVVGISGLPTGGYALAYADGQICAALPLFRDDGLFVAASSNGCAQLGIPIAASADGVAAG